MKTGFRTAGYADWGLGPTLEDIALAGFDSVELCLEHPGCTPEILDDVRIQRVAKMLEEFELPLSSVSYHGDGLPIDEKVDKTFRALDIAHRMGAKVLVINTEPPDAARADHLALVQERLARLCNRAERCDIDIAVEPEPGLLIDSSEDFLTMAQRVGSPNLKINLDIGHAYLTDPDVVETIHKLGDKIVHIHVEDIAGGVHKHLLPGEGEMNLPAIFDALREVGYEGFLTIDLFQLGDEPGDRAREALAALQEIQTSL
ncbi:MAG: sugar phosphate isomerase/epimerase, partial [Planctomycetes bacterium]|nr:sugar phosphate isomerase/epimerase [Planctomycetota bacterium]